MKRRKVYFYIQQKSCLSAAFWDSSITSAVNNILQGAAGNCPDFFMLPFSLTLSKSHNVSAMTFSSNCLNSI